MHHVINKHQVCYSIIDNIASLTATFNNNKNKLKSLKVAQSKDDDGGVGDGVVNTCVIMFMLVCG